MLNRTTLTYNFWNTAATDIKYVLVENFESACTNTFKIAISDVITNVFEARRGTPRLIMITTYTNMTYHEYQGMFDIALF